MNPAVERLIADIERQTGGRVELTARADGTTRAAIHGGEAHGLAADVRGDEDDALRELRGRLTSLPTPPPSVFTEPMELDLSAAQQGFVNDVERAYGAAHVSFVPAPADRTDRRPWARVTALDVEPCPDCDATGRFDRGEHQPCPIAAVIPDVHADVGGDCIFCGGLGVILDPELTCAACHGLGQQRHPTARWLIDPDAGISPRDERGEPSSGS